MDKLCIIILLVLMTLSSTAKACRDKRDVRCHYTILKIADLKNNGSKTDQPERREFVSTDKDTTDKAHKKAENLLDWLKPNGGTHIANHEDTTKRDKTEKKNNHGGLLLKLLSSSSTARTAGNEKGREMSGDGTDGKGNNYIGHLVQDHAEGSRGNVMEGSKKNHWDDDTLLTDPRMKMVIVTGATGRRANQSKTQYHMTTAPRIKKKSPMEVFITVLLLSLALGGCLIVFIIAVYPHCKCRGQREDNTMQESQQQLEFMKAERLQCLPCDLPASIAARQRLAESRSKSKEEQDSEMDDWYIVSQILAKSKNKKKIKNRNSDTIARILSKQEAKNKSRNRKSVDDTPTSAKLLANNSEGKKKKKDEENPAEFSTTIAKLLPKIEAKTLTEDSSKHEESYTIPRRIPSSKKESTRPKEDTSSNRKMSKIFRLFSNSKSKSADTNKDRKNKKSERTYTIVKNITVSKSGIRDKDSNTVNERFNTYTVGTDIDYEDNYDVTTPTSHRRRPAQYRTMLSLGTDDYSDDNDGAADDRNAESTCSVPFTPVSERAPSPIPIPETPTMTPKNRDRNPLTTKGPVVTQQEALSADSSQKKLPRTSTHRYGNSSNRINQGKTTTTPTSATTTGTARTTSSNMTTYNVTTSSSWPSWDDSGIGKVNGTGSINQNKSRGDRQITQLVNQQAVTENRLANINNNNNDNDNNYNENNDDVNSKTYTVSNDNNKTKGIAINDNHRNDDSGINRQTYPISNNANDRENKNGCYRNNGGEEACGSNNDKNNENYVKSDTKYDNRRNNVAVADLNKTYENCRTPNLTYTKMEDTCLRNGGAINNANNNDNCNDNNNDTQDRGRGTHLAFTVSDDKSNLRNSTPTTSARTHPEGASRFSQGGSSLIMPLSNRAGRRIYWVNHRPAPLGKCEEVCL